MAGQNSGQNTGKELLSSKYLNEHELMDKKRQEALALMQELKNEITGFTGQRDDLLRQIGQLHEEIKVKRQELVRQEEKKQARIEEHLRHHKVMMDGLTAMKQELNELLQKIRGK